MNILFISLLDPSESGSGNQKVTLLSAKYLSSVGIHCFIAYFKDSEYSSSQLVFDAKFKIDYNDLDGFRSFLIDNEISIIHNQASRAVNMKFLGQAVAGLKVKIISVLHNLPGTENIRYNKQSLLFQVLNRRISFKWLIYLLLLFFYPITRFLVKYTTKRKYKSIYKYSDALVLLSDAYIPIYRSIANLKDSSKMVSIPNFLSFDYVERNYSKTNELLIVARFDEISKRILLALKIWKHFLSTYDVRDWCLTIVGYGEWESVYKDFINKNDIVNVKLVGRDDSKKYFERSSILMFTSLLEGAPLSLLEAMQMKVIKSLDISEYSRSIYDLITNEKLRCKLSENAFNCLHYFTVKNVMLRWVDLYNSLLK